MAQVVRYWPHTADFPGFSPRPVCMGFVVDKVALGQGLLLALRFSPVIVISSVLHTFPFLHH